MTLMQAMGYPFKKRNIVSTLVIPTLLLTLAAVSVMVPLYFLLLPIYTAAHSAMSTLQYANDAGSTPQLATIVQNALVSLKTPLMALALLFMLWTVPIQGYYWEVIRRVQLNGLDAEVPTWRGCWREHFSAGCQSLICCIVLFIPIMLGMLTFGLLMPFALAPYIYAARDKRYATAFAGMGIAMRHAASNYSAVMSSLYGASLLQIPYSIVMGILSLTLLGLPFAMMLGAAYHLTCCLMISESYGFEGDPNYVAPVSQPAQPKAEKMPRVKKESKKMKKDSLIGLPYEAPDVSQQTPRMQTHETVMPNAMSDQPVSPFVASDLLQKMAQSANTTQWTFGKTLPTAPTNFGAVKHEGVNPNIDPNLAQIAQMLNAPIPEELVQDENATMILIEPITDNKKQKKGKKVKVAKTTEEPEASQNKAYNFQVDNNPWTRNTAS